MSSIRENILKKRRLMFSTDVDYYYLTYNTLLVLDSFKKYGEKYLCDIRKLPFIADLISRHEVFESLRRCREGHTISSTEVNILSRSYSRCLVLRSEAAKVAFALERKKLLSLRGYGKSVRIDASLVASSDLKDFLSQDIWKNEKQRMDELKALVPRLSSIKFESLIESVYKDCGVTTWDF